MMVPNISSPKVPRNSSELAVNMALISFAGLLIYAGFKGGSIIDVFNGQVGSQGPASNPANAKKVAVEKTTPATGKTPTKTPSSVAGGGTTMFDGKPVANWLIKPLTWARKNGWKGKVNSGYRNQTEQRAAATRYGLQHYPNGDPSGSNHTKTRYPGGAVDVTEPAQLAQVLRRYPGFPRPVWGGPVINDQPHFSATGH